jgi:ribosomal protein S18 acetylase RimI-like enzyme
MEIEPAGVDDVDTLTGLWVDLARDQRLYRSHLKAEPNRAAISEAISRSVVTDGIRVARREQDGDGDGDGDGDRDRDRDRGRDRDEGRGESTGRRGSTRDGDGTATDASERELPHPPAASPAVDEGVLGFVMFGLETGGYEQDVTRGVIHNLYVRPAHRDRGIGSRLLAAAERELAARDADVVSLEAMMANQAAVRFYERNGYRRHRVELEKRLDDSASDGE